jgi:hypothetical protein
VADGGTGPRLPGSGGRRGDRADARRRDQPAGPARRPLRRGRGTGHGWQVARRGNLSVDLGYFLQGALVTEDRRAHERELLGVYRDALGMPAGELPSAEEIWLRYRASVAHGLTTWLATASAGELWQRPDIALALAQRYSAAYQDLNTAEALAELTT